MGLADSKAPGPVKVGSDADIPGNEVCSQLTVAEVVDAIGIGPAQLRCCLLGGGAVFLCDGAELILGNVVILSISKEFDLGPNKRACISTLTLAGLMAGTFLSGYIGDTWGRRRPTIWCLAWTALFGFLCAIQSGYYGLLVCRCALGLGMGFGMPPGSALISESTPEQWRIPVRVLATSLFSLGGLFLSILAAIDDPTLTEVHWRRLVFFAALLPVLFGTLAALWLPESPLFLASVGKHADAREALKTMARLNRAEGVNIDYGESDARTRSGGAGLGRVLSLWEQLGTIFSPELRYTTFAAFYAAFCINLVSYGDGYAAPQVLASASSLAPAWQLVIKMCISVLWTLLCGMVAQAFSRKCMMVVATVISTTVCFAFAIAGSCEAPRPVFLEVLFQYGANGSPVGSALGYVVVFQLAVEIYPTTAATTGGALIMGGGRAAAICAPLIFENLRRATSTWSSFYYMMGTTAALGVAVVAFMPTVKAYRQGQDSGGEAALPGRGAGLGRGYGATA